MATQNNQTAQYNLASLKPLDPLSHWLTLCMFSVLHYCIGIVEKSTWRTREVWLTWAHHLLSSHLHQPLCQNWCSFSLPSLKAMTVCDSVVVINDGLLNFHLGWPEFTCTDPRHAGLGDYVRAHKSQVHPRCGWVLPQSINYCSLLLPWPLASFTKRLCRATLALCKTWATFRFADKVSSLCLLNNLACSYCL